MKKFVYVFLATISLLSLFGCTKVGNLEDEYIAVLEDDLNIFIDGNIFEITERIFGVGSDSEAMDDITVFERIPSKFVFSSGVGNWRTGISIDTDGTFSGQYYDLDMGDTGPGYPNGTVYISDFDGKFSIPKQISEYIYSMKVDSLNVKESAGTVYYENDIRYIVSNPSGFDNADEFFIYLPGAENLPEGFRLCTYLNNDPFGFYGIYNTSGENCFVGME